MQQRISLITLGVTDLARARDFYEEGLGFVKANPHEEVAFYQLPGLVLALWSRAELAADAEVTDDTPGFGGFALAHNVGSPSEVDAVFAEAVAAGATVRKAPVATPWGGYSGYLADPDGHLWEIAHNPEWIIGEDGSTSLP